MTHLARRRLLAALAVAALSGCHSAPTRLYSLYPVVPASPLAYTGPAVRIDAVHLPPEWDRTPVISNLPRGQLQIHDLAYWSAPLGSLMRQVLSADLMGRLPPGKVLFPHLNKPAGALGIRVDVLQLMIDGTDAILQAGWTISCPAPPTGSTAACSRADPRETRASVTLHQSASVTSAERVTERLSQLLGVLADRMSSSLGAARAE